MQVKIGEKIKELRKVTGRKQEDLATALGVTPQAISRWEANGGYPDMEMIPSIANYFHISIDELFGYNNDRNRIIQEYNDKAQWLINNNDDMTECIALMRRGLEEFPDRVDFKTKLACALHKQGWKNKGKEPNIFGKKPLNCMRNYCPMTNRVSFRYYPYIPALVNMKKPSRKHLNSPTLNCADKFC